MEDLAISDQGPLGIPSTGFLWSPVWWQLVRRSLGVALMGAVGALAYVWVISRGTDLVWGDDAVPTELFSGSFKTVAIMSVGGLVVGLIYRFVPRTGASDVFGGLTSGGIEPEPVPGGLLVSVVSLVSGYSLGPEVPTGMIAGGAASAVARSQDWDDTTQKVTFGAAISGAYGGLFTSPFVATLLVLEMRPSSRLMYLSVLTIEVVASLTGFAVFFAAGGFATLLSELSFPDYHLELWHFAAAMAIAFVGAAGGLLVAALSSTLHRLVAPLAQRVVLRGVLAGAALGLLGWAIPLTLFSGGSTLPEATAKTADIGIAVLLVTAVAKIVAMTAARSFGFIGGPIFPLVFAGGLIGAAVHGLFPDVPLALSVTAGMASLSAAVMPLPLTLGVLAIVIAGTSMELGAPILTASVTASLLVQGLKRVTRVADVSAP